jgi:Xaa-Pro dipeptidase
MTGRRSFLGGVGGVAALAALPLAGAACETSLGQPAKGPADAKAYPPLPPLADAVFAKRQDCARALAAEAGGDVAFVTSGTTSFAYLAGARVERSERLIALILPALGEPVLVAPSFELERLRRQTRLRTLRGWEEHEDPYAVVRDVMTKVGKAPRIVVEPHTEHLSAVALSRVMPEAALVDGTQAFERLRVVKDEDELLRIRRAIEITHDVFDAAFAALRPGARDREVSEAIADDFRRAGVDGYALVQFGPMSALPHGRPRGDALGKGMVVLIDGGCVVDGYWSDVTRTRFFGGPPPADFVRVWETVYDAQSAAIARVRPGVAAEEVDRAARDVITKAGYGAYFTHRTGHGMGMDGHEPSYIVLGNAQPLAPGFVFSVEPGVYLPEAFGVRIEDDVACGPDGAVVLSRRAARADARRALGT